MTLVVVIAVVAAVPGQPDTVNVEPTTAVWSAFWFVSVAVAVPVGVWQVVRNSPSGPPSRETVRFVSGMSGRPVNAAESVSRSTEPVSVSGNGAGNRSVSDSPDEEPVRYALPESGVG